jgi:hypothetical protein
VPIPGSYTKANPLGITAAWYLRSARGEHEEPEMVEIEVDNDTIGSRNAKDNDSFVLLASFAKLKMSCKLRRGAPFSNTTVCIPR